MSSEQVLSLAGDSQKPKSTELSIPLTMGESLSCKLAHHAPCTHIAHRLHQIRRFREAERQRGTEAERQGGREAERTKTWKKTIAIDND